MLFPLLFRLNTNILFDFLKLSGYLASAVNPCVNLILALFLHQELRYLYFCYKYSQMSSYQLQK